MTLIKEYTYIILVIIVSNNSLINTKYLIDYIYIKVKYEKKIFIFNLIFHRISSKIKSNIIIVYSKIV